MNWLRSLHRYLGVAAAAFLFVLAVTGGVLIFKEEIWRLRFPALAEPLAEPSAAGYAAAFAAIGNRYAGRVVLIRVPHPTLSAYHVYLRGGEALWRQDGGGPIAEWAWYESPLGVLTELHIHLAAGDAGKTALGYLGLLTAVMAVSGVVLWWPVRRLFRLAALRPSNFRRASLLRLHRDLGSLAAVFIALFGLTASAVVFGQASRDLFNRVLGSDSPRATPPRIRVVEPVPMPDARVIGRAMAELPRARLKSYSPPAPGHGLHYFRLRQPGEVHPNGRSTVYIDARNGTVIQRSDATQAPAGDRLAHWMYPLHAAHWGGWPYRFLALLSALALAVMSATGMVCFVRGTRWGKRPKA